MIPFFAVAVLLAAFAWRLLRPRAAAGLAVAVVLVLPPLYAAAVLWDAAPRLDALELRYVGKRLAWGPGLALTGGGSVADGAVEDLYGGLLGAGSLRIEPASEAEAAALGEAVGDGGVRAGTPLLHLAGSAPVVTVDGEVVNAVALEEGDVLVIGGGDRGLEAELRDGALHAGGRSVPLPGALESFLQPGRVAFLPDLLAALDPERPADRVLSFLDRHAGGWRLVLRDEELRVRRGGGELARLTTPRPLPRSFELQLQVVRGDVGERRLRTVREDEVRLLDDHAEIRFGEPERHRVPLAEVWGPLEVGVVVPSSSDRRPRLIELGERSGRFHGLAATLRFEPATGEARLEYLGGAWVARPGALYGLGEGDDLMLVRLERTRFPLEIPLELAALSLFLGVFLGPSMRTSPALTAVAGTAGLLLAHRLLFAWRAATQPPDFFLRGYAEARLALWLVPALLLFGWTAGVVLRRLGSRGGAAATEPGSAAPASTSPARTEPAAPRPAGPGWRAALARGARILRWPLSGLLVAATGCVLTVRGGGGDLPALALVPVVLAVLLAALYLLAVGPLAPRLATWSKAGWRWPLWGLAAAGLAWLLIRLLSDALGMAEALRLPPTGFRLLWTVVQLPVSALLVGLGCHAAREAADGAPERPLPWLGGVASVAAYLILAFALVGLAVGDTGLLLVHGLSLVFALVLLVVPWGATGGRIGGWKPAAVRGLTLALALAPLVLVLAANLVPSRVVRLVDRVVPGGAVVAEAGEARPAGDPEVDVAERMRGTTQQQLFRLYMLANPERLRDVGLKPAERVAVQYETLRAYAGAAGFAGEGFHASRLPRHLGVTYLNDLMPMAFVLADFGKLGLVALVLLYLAVLAGAVAAFRAAGDRWGRQGAWIAAVALLAFALPGIYMALANLNLVLFTGKNSSLLALNSVSDVLESGALLAVAGFGAALAAAGKGGR